MRDILREVFDSYLERAGRPDEAYRRCQEESGAVCNRILSVSPVYALQTSAASTPQLAGQWRIVTDTYQYYVDSSTGSVVRA